jgi:hypothetical protein
MNHRMAFEIRRAIAGICVLAGLSPATLLAAPGDNALTLDTQSGIRDGQGGTVLQSASFVHAPIVTPASPVGDRANQPPVLIVEPRVGLSGKHASAQSSGAQSSSTGVAMPAAQ